MAEDCAVAVWCLESRQWICSLPPVCWPSCRQVTEVALQSSTQLHFTGGDAYTHHCSGADLPQTVPFTSRLTLHGIHLPCCWGVIPLYNTKSPGFNIFSSSTSSFLNSLRVHTFASLHFISTCLVAFQPCFWICMTFFYRLADPPITGSV